VRAILYVIVCVSLWGLIPVVSKTGQIDLDNHQFLFWSSLISFLAYLPFFLFKRKSYGFIDFTKMVALGFLGTYLYYIFLYYGYSHAKGLEVLVLQYSWPLFIILLSVILLKEKLNLRRWISAFLGFLAVILIISHGNFKNIYLQSFKVDLIVIIAAIVFALFSVLSKNVSYDPYTLLTVYFLTATVFSFASMLIFSKFSFPTSRTLLPILINGIFVNGYSYLFWILALRFSEASFIAPFVFLTPVFSTIYLVLFFGERLSPIYGLSLSLIIISGLINQKR